MKLRSSNYLYCLIIFSLFFNPLKSEEKIDIWNSKEKKIIAEDKLKTKKKKNSEIKFRLNRKDRIKSEYYN